MTTMTWDKLLQSQGFGSRKECRHLVAAGEVAVAGEAVADWRAEAPPEVLAGRLEFTVLDEPQRYRRQVYLALHKPPGHECSRKASHHPGVLSLLPEEMERRGVQPVGRLDHDTTGLLLLSDDGTFIHAQSSPKRRVPKVYVATTHAPVDEALVAALRRGVTLHDEPAPLAALHCLRLSEHEVEIILEQGKYHQVKRMLAAAGNHCTALRRTAIGGLRLDDLGLAEGDWCFLEADHLALLAPAAP